MRLVTALALALTVVGCTAGQPTRFYTLAAVAEAPETPPAGLSELTVGVGPVTLPSYLDRPQLVTRAGSNRAVLAEFDSWVEPLDGLFARVLAENPALLLGTDDVLTLPQRRALALDYQVDVTRFDVDTSGNAVLDARWWVLDRDGERILRSGRSTISEPTQVGDRSAKDSARDQPERGGSMFRSHAKLTATKFSISSAIAAIPSRRASGRPRQRGCGRSRSEHMPDAAARRAAAPREVRHPPQRAEACTCCAARETIIHKENRALEQVDRMTMGPRIRWEENSWPALEDLLAREPIVILPIGAVEQHGRHLAVGVDASSAESVAVRAAEALCGRDPPVLVLPTMWYGYSPHHMAFKGTVTLRSDTFLAVVTDVVESVLEHGTRRVVMLNGHGGNVSSLDVVASRLGHAWHGRARIASVTYFRLAAARAAEFRESHHGGMGHACEFETSLQLALRPDLVDMTAAATCYPELPSSRQSTDLFATSLVHAYHDFRDLSPSGVLGDPGLASKAKGERILRACVEELSAFLLDFASWPIG